MSRHLFKKRTYEKRWWISLTLAQRTWTEQEFWRIGSPSEICIHDHVIPWKARTFTKWKTQDGDRTLHIYNDSIESESLLKLHLYISIVNQVEINSLEGFDTHLLSTRQRNLLTFRFQKRKTAISRGGQENYGSCFVFYLCYFFIFTWGQFFDHHETTPYRLSQTLFPRKIFVTSTDVTAWQLLTTRV